MTKNKDTDIQNEMIIEEESAPRGRPARRKVYERVRSTMIPEAIKQHFAKRGYDLRLVRWSVGGVEDQRSLTTRENEGYEFVDAKELPDNYLKQLRLADTRSRNGLVTMGDLCLMKIDSELRQSRRDYFADETKAEMDAVDVHVLEKKGFRNLGTRSKVIMREPTFSD
jgi:hypothetical protein